MINWPDLQFPPINLWNAPVQNVSNQENTMTIEDVMELSTHQTCHAVILEYIETKLSSGDVLKQAVIREAASRKLFTIEVGFLRQNVTNIQSPYSNGVIQLHDFYTDERDYDGDHYTCPMLFDSDEDDGDLL